jgi:hypothetical protein
MNDQTLDRDLRNVFGAGPRSAPPASVDRAIAAARHVEQRRPRVVRLDRRAWPPKQRTAADPAVHRAVRLLAAAVVVVLLGAIVAVGARLLDRPPTVTIVTAGSLDQAIHDPRLAAWPDGRILVEAQDGRVLFDLVTGATESLAYDAPWNDARTDVLPDGRVMLTRSVDAESTENRTIEVASFDRKTRNVESAGSIATPWFAASTLVLRDGRILISGGVLFESGELPCGPLTCQGVPTPAPTATYESSVGAKDTVRLFDPTTGTTTDVGHLQVARYQHQMVELDDGRVLVIGGGEYATDAVENNEALEVEVFDLAAGSSKVVGSLKPGRLPFSFPAVNLDDGRIVISEATTSEFPCGIPSFVPGQPVHPEDIRRIFQQPTTVFDPATDRVSAGPTLPHSFGGNLVSLAHGRALAFGAYQVFPADCVSKPDPEAYPWLGIADVGRNTVFETYNPMTDIASLDVAVSRAYGAGLRLPDGRVALIADDPLSGEKNAIDIVAVGP